MGKPLIVVSSATYAMKAKDILLRHGIRSYVERVPKTAKTGCGYGLYVPGGIDTAERILRDNNIRVLGRFDKDDGG